MDTRERILDAAADVMSTLGLAHTTTKEIARTAGYSEATLYKHFRDKEELFTYVLAERMPSFIALLEGLSHRAGQGTVRANLEETARAALEFFRDSFPMAASLFAEPQLLAAHREALHRRGGGPHKANEALAAYLRAEQGLGRVARDAYPEAAASLLLGACFQRAFLTAFASPGGEWPEDLAEALAHTLVRALTPAGLAPDDSE